MRLFLRNKHKGWAFIFGVFLLVFTLTLGSILYQRQKLNIAITSVQDALTASGMAVLDVDTQNITLFGNLTLSDNNKNNDNTGSFENLNDVNRMYEQVIDLIAINLNMEHEDGTYLANITSENKLYNTSVYPACVKKVIFYDVKDEQIRSYTYTSQSTPDETDVISKNREPIEEIPNVGYSSSTNTSSFGLKTPTGQEVKTDTVSVYIEFQFPVKIMGIEKYVTKQIYCNLFLE